MSDLALNPTGMMLPTSISRDLPAMVAAEVAKLPAAQQSMFAEEYSRKAKSGGLGLVLAIFGLHYIYLGKIGMFFAFIFTAAGLGIWWIVDLFRISGMIREHNRDLATDTLRTMSMIRT